jgi:redox-sensitive bicupin YhaK (pirin superfamily)
MNAPSPALVATTPIRPIVHRARGRSHGPITRLVSPGDVGELIKPFVFLDYIKIKDGKGPGFGWHPHSGIATLTFMLEGDMRYADSTGQSGVLWQGGLEWMNAGGGVWHTGGPAAPGVPVTAKGFQLWVALPEALELGEPRSQYVPAAEVPVRGPARVLLGVHEDARSPIDAPEGMTYLAVTLRAGERWRYEPPAGHDVLWACVFDGELLTPAALKAAALGEGDLAVFEESGAAIDFETRTGAGFILGSAAKHPHDLALGYYSVHTSAHALARGEAGIERVGARLLAEGVIGR